MKGENKKEPAADIVQNRSQYAAFISNRVAMLFVFHCDDHHRGGGSSAPAAGSSDPELAALKQELAEMQLLKKIAFGMPVKP
jgi:hypothetical protein